MHNQMNAYNIKTGHVRFKTVLFENGNVQIQVYSSNKKVPIKTSLTHDELWNDQEVVPVFALHCESVDQLEGYVMAFEESIQLAKNHFERMNSEKE